MPSSPTTASSPAAGSSSPPSPPDVFQHYQVLRRPDGSLWELGRGAMGITYKAFDVNLRCYVALKVVNAQHLNSETAKARFVREARAAARLRHPNVASVYHLGMDAESFFYAMEFIDGETLESLVRRLGPLAPATALRLALQVARALIASSRQRLVHRDIKPANLMVVRDEDDEGDEHAQLRVKVIDFGLARSLFSTSGTGAPPSTGGGAALSNVTLGGFVGTPLFASPEQLEEKDLDARSDFYSLGVTLWYLVAGQPPFTGTLASIISQHLTREAPLENLPPAVPEPVRALLARLLQKDPAQRPQTGGELRSELEACLRAVLAERASRDGADGAGTITDPEGLFNVEVADLPATGRRTDGDSGFATGTVLGGRFRLVRFVGEGSEGRIFLARDLQMGDAPTAVRVLPADLIVTPHEEETFRADFERARQAPHPALLHARSFERHGPRYYLAQEWVNGFTLVDLLRNRGTLALEDALRVLRPAALAADHAAAHGISHRIDFAPHQILLHFPGDRVNDGAETPLRPVPLGPLGGWPEWQVKLNPLGVSRGAADLATWAGDMTLVPDTERMPMHDTHSSIAGWTPETGRLLPALGRLVYEMLGGGMTAGGAGLLRYVNRPALSEEANAVLGRCVNGDEPGFATGMEFYEILARTAGYDPETLRPFVSAPPPLLTPPAPAPAPLPPHDETLAEDPPAASALEPIEMPSAGTDPLPVRAAKSASDDAATLAAVPPAVATTVHGSRPVVPRTPRGGGATGSKAKPRTPARKIPAAQDDDEAASREQSPAEESADRFAPLSARAAAARAPVPKFAAESSPSVAASSAPPPASHSSAEEWRDMLLGEPSAGRRWLPFAAVAALLLFCGAAVFAYLQTRRPPARPAVVPTASISPTPASAPPKARAAVSATPRGTTVAAATPSALPSAPRSGPAERPAAPSASPATALARSAAASPRVAHTVTSPRPPQPAAPSPQSLASEIAASPATTPPRPPPAAIVAPPPPVLSSDSPGAETRGTTATGSTASRSLEVAPIEPPPVPPPDAVTVPAPTPALVAATSPKATSRATPPAETAPESPTPPVPVASAATRPPETSAPAEPGSENTAATANRPPTPAPAAGKLVAVHLTSEPSKAEITLRGETLGVTPKTVMLPPGEHELAAHYWNWPEVRQQIYLSPEDKTAEVKIRLISPDQIPINRPSPPDSRTTRKERAREIERQKREKFREATAPLPAPTPAASVPPPPAAIPVTPEPAAPQAQAPTPTPTPRRRGPFGIFGPGRSREQPSAAPTPVMPAAPVIAPPVQPFFDGRGNERPPDRSEVDRPRI